MKQQLTTLVLGEVPKAIRGNVFRAPTVKSGPHYFPSSVPHLVAIGEEKRKVEGKEITFAVLGYAPYIIVIQASVEPADIFDKNATSAWEQKLYAESYKILKKRGGSDEWSEMYSIFSVSGYEGEPEQFLTHAPEMAALLKSETIELDPKEVEYTLSTQIKYAKHDLAIIDWDGAFLFDVEGDFGLAVELLTLANLQLLRHRLLDRRLDEQLDRITKIVNEPESNKKFLSDKSVARDVKSILRRRLTWISAFESIERDIKLIGDWYSARFYDLASHKMKVSEWRGAIKDKLDSLENVYSTLVENFTITSKEKAEWVETIAWFVLQAGWFVLIVLEFLYYTK
jgi:hypothetical protein